LDGIREVEHPDTIRIIRFREKLDEEPSHAFASAKKTVAFPAPAHVVYHRMILVQEPVSPKVVTMLLSYLP
jgi:hypothetical protein